MRKNILFGKTALVLSLVLLLFIINGCDTENKNTLSISKDDHIVLVGNNLGSRMMNFGHFETEMQMRYPDSLLFIRNMSDPGNTPGFRPHPSRKSPWAFPGAEEFEHEPGVKIHYEERRWFWPFTNNWTFSNSR